MTWIRGLSCLCARCDVLRDKRGATAVECGLIAGLMALTIIGAVSSAFYGVGASFNGVGIAL